MDSDFRYPTAYPIGHWKIDPNPPNYLVVWSLVKPYLVQMYEDEFSSKYARLGEKFDEKAERLKNTFIWSEDMLSSDFNCEFNKLKGKYCDGLYKNKQNLARYHMLIQLVCKKDPNQ